MFFKGLLDGSGFSFRVGSRVGIGGGNVCWTWFFFGLWTGWFFSDQDLFGFTLISGSIGFSGLEHKEIALSGFC